jgi:restriction endonuclease S subunit
MVVTTIVNISDFEFGNRIDAELYRPSLRHSFDILNRTNFELIRLRRTCIIRSGTTPPDRVDGLKDGPILFKTTDIRNGVISSYGDYYRVSNAIHHRMGKTKIAERDVLLNIVGATLDVIGRTGFIAHLKEEANITQAMAFLRSRTPSLLSGYLFAFLNTRYGQDQIARYARPTGQYNLNLQEVGHILIPLLPESEQKLIEDTILKSSNLLEDSERCYIQAQQLLESGLGLDKLRFEKPVGYTVQFSELELSRRFDSEHYYPAFDNLKDKLPKHIQLVPLGSVLTSCQRGKQPIYSTNGLPVLNSKHILENKIILEGNRYAKTTFVTGLQIQYGDVLINGTGRGTIGRTAPYLISEHQAIPDNHVTILRSSTLDPAYLSFYLNSLAGKLQVEKYQRGSSGQLELYPFDIRKFQVWEAPQSIQQEIRQLYDQATESARQSKQLIDQAKSRVEQLIEEAVQL